MGRWKAEQGRGREKRKIRRKKRKKKEDADARKGRKVAKHCVFPLIWGSGGSKGRLAKAVGAEPAGQMRDEKLHAVVARSTFASQNVQNTPGSDHFWQLRCWKSARRCGAKHISKSKCTKHTILGPLLEVQMSKKCTPLWREAHFQVKMYKAHHVRTCSDHFWKLRCRKSARRCGAKHISKSKCTKHLSVGRLLEVEMWEKCTPLWREAHLEVKMLKTLGVRTTFGGSDVASLRFTTLHYTTLHSTTLRYTTLHYTTLHNTTTTTTQLHNYTTTLHYTTTTTTQLHSTRLNYTTLHYITLHSTTLHYTTLHYLPLHFTTLHYTTLHYTTTTTTTTQLHSTTLNYTTLHYITLHYTPLHYTTLHYTTLPSTTLHYITLHYTTPQLQLQLHSTTLHYTKLHYTTLHYTTLHYIPLHSTKLHYITLHYITLNDTAPQIDR